MPEVVQKGHYPGAESRFRNDAHGSALNQRRAEAHAGGPAAKYLTENMSSVEKLASGQYR